jgi:predicted nuclease with TOPRIM domain
VHFTIEAGKVREVDPRVITELIKRAAAFREVHGVAPSAQAAREWRKELDRAQDEHRTVHTANELNRLRAENQKLRAELQVAKARIRELETENARLSSDRHGRGPIRRPRAKSTKKKRGARASA